MLRGVIFDFDGVLVDSEQAHFEALRAVLQDEAGIVITRGEYQVRFMGFDDHTCFRRALEVPEQAATPGRIANLVDRKWAVYGDRLQDIPLLPGALTLVLALREAGVPLVIASGSRRDEIESILRGHELIDAFRGIVSSDDVRNFKPHPEPYLRARMLLEATGSGRGIVAIEDSSPGLASARAADLSVIGVATSHPREKLDLAHLVVDSLEALSVDDVVAVTRRSSVG